MISILVATYNAADVLQDCLDSIFAQRDADFELLVADGVSSDGTLAILERHSDRLAYWHSAPDEGIYDAWNSLLPHVRGEWLMFLGADDALYDTDTLNRLEAACAQLEPRSPQLDYVYGITELVAADEVIERLGTEALADDRLPLDRDVRFSHTGLLHHRDLFETFGGFDTRFRIAGDNHFIMRSARDPRTRFHHVDQVVARMAAGGVSTGARSRLRCYREIEEARRLLQLDPALPGWLRSHQLRATAACYIDRFVGRRALLLASNLHRLLSGKPTRRGYE